MIAQCKSAAISVYSALALSRAIARDYRKLPEMRALLAGPFASAGRSSGAFASQQPAPPVLAAASASYPPHPQSQRHGSPPASPMTRFLQRPSNWRAIRPSPGSQR